MTDASITVRAVTDVTGLRAIEDLQIAVWRMDERDVVPLHHLLAASGAGGRVLGAFTADGTLVGFCYGFAGVRGGRTFLYSHMAGVLAEFRGRNVGVRLKHAQREAALAEGFDRMVWTFDPLQSGNAYFNLHKLGAEARRYHVNYYGEMRDELNQGMESDRLEVDWWLRDPRVEARLREERAKRPGAEEGYRARSEAHGTPRWIDIPADIASLRRSDPDAARRWRETTREQFLAAFAQGYAAVDVERYPARSAYVLIRAAGPPETERSA